jgi:hypothetical protein
MRSRSFLAAIFVAALALSAAAQNPPARIRGTVERLDGQTLMIKSRDGQSLSIALAPNFTVRAVVAKTVADIKPGDFVASTSVKGSDGKLRAIEVHILPESLRGVAREGQFPWDLAPDSLMTNATAAQITSAPEGQVMRVTYKDGEAEVTPPHSDCRLCAGRCEPAETWGDGVHHRAETRRWQSDGLWGDRRERWRETADVSHSTPFSTKSKMS